MPSVSGRQHRYMEMLAHSPPQKGRGPSKKVAQEFVAADKKSGKFRKKKKS